MKVFINDCLKQVFLHPSESKVFTGQVAKWRLLLESDSTEYIIEIESLSEEFKEWLKRHEDSKRHLALRVAPLPNGSRLRIKWKFTKTLQETLGEASQYYSVMDLYSPINCPKEFLKGSSIRTIQVLKDSEGFKVLDLEGVKFMKVYLSNTLRAESAWRKLGEAPNCVLSFHGSGSVTIPKGFKGKVLLDSNLYATLGEAPEASCFVSTSSGKIIDLKEFPTVQSDKTLREIIREYYGERIRKYHNGNLSDEKFLKAVSLLQEVEE